jgi:hypothetical protein
MTQAASRGRLARTPLVLGLLALALAPSADGAAAAGARVKEVIGVRTSQTAVRLVYSSSWSGPSELYVADPSGRAPVAQLTFAPASAPSTYASGCYGPGIPQACGAEDPVPSPDGRNVLYLSSGGLWVVRADGSSPRLIWPGAAGDRFGLNGVEWSPDSSRVALADSKGWYVVRADASGARTVGRAPTNCSGDTVWSPDSRRVSWSCGACVEASWSCGVLRARSPDGAWTVRTYGQSFVATGADGTVWNVAGSSPVWAPRGHLLAYASAGGIFTFDVRTGAKRRLTGDLGFGLVWSPDGSRLAYVNSDGTPTPNASATSTGDLRTVSLSGTVRTVVAANGTYGGPILSLAWMRAPAALRYRRPAPTDGLYTRWRVNGLVADGGRVAYATCAGLSIWDTATGAVTDVRRLDDRPLCDPRSRYLDFESLALAGDRVAYSIGWGGNLASWELASAQLMSGATAQSILLDRGSCFVCPIPVPQVAGAGGLLVFDSEQVDSSAANWQLRRVESTACPCTPLGDYQLQPRAYVFIDDVDTDRIVIDRPDYLRILDGDGNTLLALPVHTFEAALTGNDLIVHLGSELRDYDATSGALKHTYEPPGLPTRTGRPGALQDAAHGLVAYIIGDQVHLLRLADGADTTLAPATLARFDDTGLVYADQARIHLIPYDRLPLR